MHILLVIFLLLLCPLSATYILIDDGERFNRELKSQLFDLILRGEDPFTFYSTPLDLKVECKKLVPSLRLEWIPPTLWQIAALHAFFFDAEVRAGILACGGKGWEPLCYDEMLHSHLVSVRNMEEIAELFHVQSKSLPNIEDLFFKVNQAIVSLYKRGHGSDAEILHLAISEIPPLNEWREKHFPFWSCPWIYNPHSIQLFYQALQDEPLLSSILTIEKTARKNGEWVLYRGYTQSVSKVGPGLRQSPGVEISASGSYVLNIDPLAKTQPRELSRSPGPTFETLSVYDGSTDYPSTLEMRGDGNHALSFGSTLLGGAFFSLEASALSYCKSESPLSHRFLALRVTPQEMKKIFRVGPIHPFIQMLVDGEMFHAHTKIAIGKSNEHINKRLQGYFMKCNKYCTDPIGYLLNPEMTPEDLEKIFRANCEKSGHVFLESSTSLLPK